MSSALTSSPAKTVRSNGQPPSADGSGLTGLLDSLSHSHAAGGPAWLKSRRESALARVRALGSPTIKDEDWRFTNVAPLWQLPLRAAARSSEPSPAQIKPFLLGLQGPRLVFVDGHFCASLSSTEKIDGLRFGSLSAALSSDAPELEKNLACHADGQSQFFTALNTAFFTDGAFVSVAAGRTIEQPVHLLYVASGREEGAVAQPRTLILAKAGAALQVLESYASLGSAAQLTNAVTELVVGDGARVEHCRVQDENDRGWHIATVQARQGRDSRWLSHSIALGARLARNSVNTVLGESGAEGVLNGLYMPRGEQLIDHHTIVDHARPRCESHEYYHGIMADRSHGVFNGKIFVREDAQKTNAKQTNRNLLLSDSASIDTKPQLEIFADDVKCTHGATIGQLSEEAVFYLRARGIGLDMARRMLIRAFASDVVERIQLPAVRDALEEMLAHRFASPTP